MLILFAVKTEIMVFLEYDPFFDKLVPVFQRIVLPQILSSRWRLQIRLKHQYLSTKLHTIMSQKAIILYIHCLVNLKCNTFNIFQLCAYVFFLRYVLRILISCSFFECTFKNFQQCVTFIANKKTNRL